MARRPLLILALCATALTAPSLAQQRPDPNAVQTLLNQFPHLTGAPQQPAPAPLAGPGLEQALAQAAAQGLLGQPQQAPVGGLAGQLLGQPQPSPLGGAVGQFLGQPQQAPVGGLAGQFLGQPQPSPLGGAVGQFLGQPQQAPVGGLAGQLLGQPQPSPLGGAVGQFLGQPQQASVGGLAGQFLGQPQPSPLGGAVGQFLGQPQQAPVGGLAGQLLGQPQPSPAGGLVGQLLGQPAPQPQPSLVDSLAGQFLGQPAPQPQPSPLSGAVGQFFGQPAPQPQPAPGGLMPLDYLLGQQPQPQLTPPGQLFGQPQPQPPQGQWQGQPAPRPQVQPPYPGPAQPGSWPEQRPGQPQIQPPFPPAPYGAAVPPAAPSSVYLGGSAPLPAASPAQEFSGFPRYVRVTGVAANDTLRVRDEPRAQGRELGELRPDAGPIEALETNADGSWTRIVHHGQNGWASSRYLTAAEPTRLQGSRAPAGLQCSGTEPFWGLRIDDDRWLTWSTPENQGGTRLAVVGISSAPSGGGTLVNAQSANQERFSAVLSPAQCSDGMSDANYGWRVELMRGYDLPGAPPPSLLSGCCRLPH